MPQPSDLSARALKAENLEDFRVLLASPPNGWCWCVAWEVPSWDGWGERDAEQNRRLREELWAKSEFHAYLFYADQKAVAWLRVGPRRSWPKLCQQFGLDPTEPVYAFGCFGMLPEFRGRGWMHRFLAQVLDALSARGVRRVEAFPNIESGPLEPGEVWTGPRALFERAGFVAGTRHPPRLHMMRELGE